MVPRNIVCTAVSPFFATRSEQFWSDLTVRPVLDDGVALTKGFEVAEQAVRGARVHAYRRGVLSRDVRRAALQHRLREAQGPPEEGGGKG